MARNHKNPWEWTEVELQILIDERTPEPLTLEYKRSDSLVKDDFHKKEISKDVSAMANSDGGVVIYGIKTYSDTGKKHIPEGFDAGIDGSQFSVECLEQVIDSNIHPKISNLRCHPVELTKKRLGRFAYIVSVSKGTRAHQAADKRYHGRIERTTTALEDYQIRDINNRLKYAVLVPEFRLDAVSKKEKAFAYNFQIFLENTGSVRAIDWKLEVVTPKEVKDVRQRVEDATVVPLGDGRCKMEINSTRKHQVIFPQDKQRVCISHNVIIANHELVVLTQTGHFSWRVFADDSEPRSGKTKFSQVRIMNTI